MIDAMINDGLTNPFSGKHMAHEASEVAAEIEMTRADMDSWSVPLAPLGQGQRGQAARGDRRRHRQGQEGRHRRPTPTDQSVRAPRSRRSRTTPIFMKDGSHTAGNAPGVNDGAGADVLASEEWAEANGKKPLASHCRHCRRLRLPRPHACQGFDRGARQDRQDAGRRRRPLGDQRGIRLGHHRLDPHDGHRRGEGQRQRRRGRMGHPIGRFRRPPSSARSCTNSVAAAADFASRPSCSGGGQGDAIVVEVQRRVATS